MVSLPTASNGATVPAECKLRQMSSQLKGLGDMDNSFGGSRQNVSKAITKTIIKAVTKTNSRTT